MRTGFSKFAPIAPALGLILTAATAVAQEVRVFDVALQAGHLKGEQDTIRVDQGTRVALRIASDQAGELHLHGYDIAIDLRAGETTVIDLDATVAGRFPITSHGLGGEGSRHADHRALLYLEVYPQ